MNVYFQEKRLGFSIFFEYKHQAGGYHYEYIFQMEKLFVIEI